MSVARSFFFRLVGLVVWLLSTVQTGFGQAATGLLTPLRNATAVPAATPVRVTFMGPVLNTTSTDGALRLFTSLRGRLQGSYTGTGSTTAGLTPTVPFLPGETAWVTARARSSSGLPVADAGQVYQFTTAVERGSGAFTAPAAELAEVGADISADVFAVADVDGDGDVDLLLAQNHPTTRVFTYLNNGQGGFSVPATGISVAVAGRVRQLLTADVDGDGDVDLLSVNVAAEVVSVRLNNGRGVFSVPTVSGIRWTGDTRFESFSVALGDLDADGDLDLLLPAVGSARVYVRLNNGQGVFTPPADPAKDYVMLVPISSQMYTLEPYAVAAADVDGDGDLDLVCGNYGGAQVSIRLNDGQAGFSMPPVAANGKVAVPDAVQAVVLADLDGDLDLDLITATSRSGVSLRFNDGHGVFTVAGPSELRVGRLVAAVAVADVDGDGDLDILIANTGLYSTDPATSGRLVSVRLNDGHGHFTAPSYGEVGVGRVPNQVMLADVDGDGDLDLLTHGSGTDRAATVSVRLNNASIPLATSSRITAATAFAATPTYVTDGYLRLQAPLAARVASADLAIYSLTGQQVLQQPYAQTVQVAALAPGWYVVHVHTADQHLTTRFYKQ